MKQRRGSVRPAWSPPPGRWSQADGEAMISAWSSSGLSMRAFAAQHGVRAQRLAYWRARVSPAAPGTGERAARSGGFARVRVAEGAPPEATGGRRITLALRGGRELRLEGAWDAPAVAALAQALEGAA